MTRSVRSTDAAKKLARMLRAAFDAGMRAEQDEFAARSLGDSFDIVQARERALREIAQREVIESKRQLVVEQMTEFLSDLRTRTQG